MSKLKRIGVITNNAEEVFQFEVVAGIKRFATERGYEVIVDSVAPKPGQRPNISLDFATVSGVLAIANVLDDATLRWINSNGKPLSLISHQVEGHAIPAVIPDNVGGITQLVDYLVTVCERRQIAFIEGDLNQNDGIERSRTFRHALMRHDLEPGPILRGNFEYGIATQSTTELLRSGATFDAIAGADYVMAIAAMNVLTEAEINIPEDLCIVGFGDGPAAAEIGLTTVGVDVDQIGYRAARQLLGQIEGLEISGVTLLSTSIVERETCLRIS